MSDSMRKLSSEEINQLQERGCSCSDWSRVSVENDFDVLRLRNVQLSGDISIASQNSQITLAGGVERKTGIYDAVIHNCKIGKNVYIDKVENYIANYDIHDNVIINHIGLMVVDGDSTFGNGERLCVINEAGGRDLPICDNLSSHVAYMLTLYRDNKPLIKKLFSLVDDYTKSVSSDRGVVASNAKIINCRKIRNVKIGESAILDGVSSLENGTINSCNQDPAFMGTSVIAKDFILCSGASVGDNSILSHCFVGQASELASQYSAENSAFFANCGCYLGEACSVFAGPFTVTHHKSTLLLAGMFSFFNAGSGSNQSNHMYKLGPVHQGILERGCKTASDSYVLWPARAGAFTLIMGRHYSNSDTSDLPFSYLLENSGESYLVPAVNLRSVGTLRDAKKWPKRDNRKDPKLLDHIIYNLLTPFTAAKMILGRETLSNLKERQGSSLQCYDYNGVRIRRSSLEKGVDLYSMGIDRYLGNIIVDKLRSSNCESLAALRSSFEQTCKIGSGSWLDISGLLAPSEAIDAVIADIVSGSLKTLESVNERFAQICAGFSDYEFCWVKNVLEQRFGKSFEEFEAQDFIRLVSNWILAVEKLDELRIADASKEYGKQAQVGFGVDGDEISLEKDFANTRGHLDGNDFILELKAKLTGKKKTAAELIEKFKTF